VWTTPDAELTTLLNERTELVETHHATIDVIARVVFRVAGLEASAEMRYFESDPWPTELPEGAVN